MTKRELLLVLVTAVCVSILAGATAVTFSGNRTTFEEALLDQGLAMVEAMETEPEFRIYMAWEEAHPEVFADIDDRANQLGKLDRLIEIRMGDIADELFARAGMDEYISPKVTERQEPDVIWDTTTLRFFPKRKKISELLWDEETDTYVPNPDYTGP